MMRRWVTCAALILMGTITGCRHKSAASPALKATAVGAAVVESSGGKQIGPAGSALKDPLIVQVNDEQGSAVAGALVEFRGPEDVHFEPSVALTDSSGQATTTVTLGTIAGHSTLTATTPGKTQPASIQIVETALGYQQQLGSLIAEKYCSRCHDSESSPARVSNYDNLEVKPHLFTEGDALNKMSDADIAAIVQHGGPALNRSALMPPYASTLSPAEVQAVIAYIRVVADPPYQPSGTVYARK
jgi:mono/diheme cytochrome c family protein